MINHKKPHKPVQTADSVNPDTSERITLMVPFFVLSFLILPSILVLAVGRTLSGFSELLDTGYLGFVRHAVWVVVPAAVICGVVYLIRGKGLLPKAGAVLLMLVLIAATIFVLIPSK